MSDRDFCEPCGHAHGPLYICEHYTDETKAAKRAAASRLRDNFRDPAWVKEHIDRAIPMHALQIMGAFVGVEPVSPNESEEPK